MAIKLCDSSDSDGEDISKIEINQDFARRYEHNKKREDLHRLEELKKKGIVDSDGDSDEEDEDDGDSDGVDDLEYLDVLLKVRNKDPILKDKEVKLFDSDQDDDDVDVTKAKANKKAKKMYLKDVTAKHLIEDGAEMGDDDYDDEEVRRGVKSYVEEQEELKKPFLDGVEEEDGEGFFKVKERGEGDEEEEENVVEVSKKLDEYFGEDEKLDENAMFLKDYFKNKMWLDKSEERKVVEDEVEVEEDEEEVEKQEDYEREFNFRYEENPGDRVLGHSRVVEGSVRKKTNARKLQRERKEERMAQAEFERKEELKYLKNLKKKEMNEKLKKIREIAGIGDGGVCKLDLSDLEEEFDPEEHDKKMKVAFGDDYYEANDADPDFASEGDEDGEIEKPDFDKEDELLGLKDGWDNMDGSGDGFIAAREKILKKKEEKGEGVVEKEERVDAVERKKKKKQKISALEAEVVKKELDEYYKLDYEDTIGDLKTRFKYRPVNAKRYGLKTKEVLLLDDKDLNQLVSLKKLAPYREKEWKVPHNIIQNQKLKIKSLLEGETSEGQRTHKRKSRDEETFKEEKLHDEESNGDSQNLSKSSKRKRQEALKLSQSRLKAYGKNPSKSKSKKQN
ncbi:KRR1-interacting protein involved in 40S ribosome biogenesis [Heracleum sosnowskyi]|uniref:KRR1-interacting protein involved in 40S ribosome biogenesis n=1 Tax=Heracleum sosnowskyi TaxID=360622 RepID=A0AAD8H7K6_9APIA|nr:KRR1-interacting protein involved in 40S ribosome biogenesis [Heracleum sosnowskyi]